MQHFLKFFKGAQSRLNGLKSLAKLFKFVVCNPWQSSPSLTILVPLWFIIISLMFFYLYKVFSGFLQFNSNFVNAQNNSKYRHWAPLNSQSFVKSRRLWDLINIIFSTSLGSWSNESSRRNLAEKPANFTGCQLLYMLWFDFLFWFNFF